MNADDISIDPLAVEAAAQRLQQLGGAKHAADGVTAIREMFQRVTVRSSNAFGRVAMMGCVEGMCSILNTLHAKLEKEAIAANGIASVPAARKKATARKPQRAAVKKKTPKRGKR